MRRGLLRRACQKGGSPVSANSYSARVGVSGCVGARLNAVEERAKALSLSAEQRLALRQRVSERLVEKLHQYLLELQPAVLPKSWSGAAVRYALNQWEALTRFLQDGELEIDNGATERANRDIALGRGNWTSFGCDGGGKTAAVLPGSATCSCASRRTPSLGSVNCFPTTGNRRLPHPRLKQSADTTRPGTSPVAVYKALKAGTCAFEKAPAAPPGGI